MANNPVTHEYSLAEEIAHSITHGIGVLLSIAGLVILVAYASIRGTAWHVVSCSIYGSTLILLYSASTLYHSVTHKRIKAILQHIDHAAIYLLIAGTYTPFMLVNLRGPWGWSLFGVVWGLALLGLILEFIQVKYYKKISLVVYLGMGWLAVVAIGPLMRNVETTGLILLLAGGLSYTIGVIFYVWRRLAFNHAIWHLFVLAGSILHFFSILFYVVP